MKLVLGMTLGMLFSPSVFAATYSATSANGKAFTIISDAALNQSSSTAVLCGAEPSGFKAVILRMPAHNHGSTPTSLTPLDDHCSRVDKLNFLMAGSWEIRTTTLNDDTAVFTVEIP